MSLKCGIVGLPNVGKSTLFNALTKAGIAAENYPFCTIEPNVGIVEVPGPAACRACRRSRNRRRSFRRSSSSSTSRASSPARRRARASATSFSRTSAKPTRSRTSCAASTTTNVVHVGGRIDPLADIETINTELALADLATVDKQITKYEKLAQGGWRQGSAAASFAVLTKVRASAERGAGPRAPSISTHEERALLKPFFLLTMKPTMYVANVAEHGFEDNPLLDARRARTRRSEGAPVVAVCAALEARDRRPRRATTRRCSSTTWA